MSESVAAFLLRHDAGRVAELLPVRYQRMQADAFAFFRGSSPLYYARFGHDPLLLNSPTGWLCGDAHAENFGSYCGDNGLAYFDVNDFDEALRGPLLWDVGRLAVSTLLAGHRFGLSPTDRYNVADDMLTAYSAALHNGKAYLLERATAKGIVHQLLKQVAHRPPRKLLIDWAGRRRRWHLKNSPGTLALAPRRHLALRDGLEAWRTAQAVPLCGAVLDIGQRVMGIGSLGVPRYVVLAEHSNPRKLPILLDLKLASTPAARYVAGFAQPVWLSEAHRVVQVQSWLQAVPPALQQPIRLDGLTFVLKALQPETDRLNFARLPQGVANFRESLPEFARLLAWAHLRAAGHQGADVPDALVAFGAARSEWQEPLLAFAQNAVAVVKKDFREFQAAYKTGALSVGPLSLALY